MDGDADDGPRGGTCPYGGAGGMGGAGERHPDALKRAAPPHSYRHSDRRRGLTVLLLLGVVIGALAAHAALAGGGDAEDGADAGADGDRPLVTDGHHAKGDDTLRQPEARGYQPGPPPGAAPGR